MIPRGVLNSRSKDINILQKFLDPFTLTFFFQILINNEYKIFNFLSLVLFIFYALILNYNQIYESYREKILLNLIPKIFFITTATSLLSILINNKVITFQSSQFIKFSFATFAYLFFHHIVLRTFLRYLRSHGFNSRSLLFFGNKESYQYLLEEINKYPWLGYKVKYWFSPNKIDSEVTDGFHLENANGGIDRLKKTIKSLNSNKVDKVLFCHSDKDDISFNEVLKILGDACIPVSYMFEWNRRYMTLEKEYIGDITLFNIWNPRSLIINQKIKRIFDLTFGFLILIILFPILFIVSIFIKFTSKGPIFFTQNRYGLNGKVFNMYKFRTMDYKKKNKPNKLEQVKINDKRITKVGRFLRKYSIDELPQLINVIKGEMSLVGPRPHAVEHNEYYRNLITGYMQRHSKLPGMTGLAQISGARGEIKNIEEMKLRINYDLEYNNNWNLIKDFNILLKTFFYVIKGDAY